MTKNKDEFSHISFVPFENNLLWIIELFKRDN